MPNIELESKYRIDNIDDLKASLQTIGAISAGSSEMVDTYFVVGQSQTGANYLRVREQNGQGELHYTFVPDNYRTDEFETKVSDSQTMKEIILKLGFVLDVIVRKSRQKFTYQEAEIVLDEVEDLGSFVEIEAQTIEKIDQIAKTLKLESGNRVENAGYPDLLRNKLKEKL